MLRRISIILAILQFACFSLSGQSFSAVTTSDGIEVSENGRKILFYQIEPKSLDGKYERANYLHPLYSLDGTVLTEDFPADHPHHHGIFWAWHQIIHNGKAIADGWTSENIWWEVTKSRTRKTKNYFILDNQVLWKSVINNSKEPIVREVSKIAIHAASSNYRIIDFDIHMLPLKDSLEIGGSDDAKGYGGFSWRIKLPDDIKFVSKDREIIPQVTAVQAGAWLDCVGSFNGDSRPSSGVAVFSHQSNPGHPQPWILRRERSMQNIAFPGRDPAKLTKKGIRLKYRVVIHDHDVNADELDSLFLTYVRKQ